VYSVVKKNGIATQPQDEITKPRGLSLGFYTNRSRSGRTTRDSSPTAAIASSNGWIPLAFSTHAMNSGNMNPESYPMSVESVKTL
jgi:hypothetical protein